MKDYKVNPLTRLRSSDLDKLILHSTVSGLRRAAAVTPCMKRVEGTDKVPTIYYIKHSPNPEVYDWTMHALVVDAQRFLLRDKVDDSSYDDSSDDDSSDDDPIRSKFYWDGITGKTENGVWVNPQYCGKFGEEIRFRSSDIEYYENRFPMPGNYVGVVISANPELVLHNPEGIVNINEIKTERVCDVFTEKNPETGNYLFRYYPFIPTLDNTTGPEYRINIKWNSEFEESFITIIYGELQGDLRCTLV
jgi:hypothetical protein